jgi:hypothetical protein
MSQLDTKLIACLQFDSEERIEIAIYLKTIGRVSLVSNLIIRVPGQVDLHVYLRNQQLHLARTVSE